MATLQSYIRRSADGCISGRAICLQKMKLCNYKTENLLSMTMYHLQMPTLWASIFPFSPSVRCLPKLVRKTISSSLSIHYFHGVFLCFVSNLT